MPVSQMRKVKAPGEVTPKSMNSLVRVRPDRKPGSSTEHTGLPWGGSPEWGDEGALKWEPTKGCRAPSASCPACLSLLPQPRELCPSHCAPGPVCPFCGPGPYWAQLQIKRLLLFPAWPRQFALKTALCPPFFPKQCVFNQFYNKTQTEFLRTTAKRNNKIIPAPAAAWAQPSSLSENLPSQACSSWLPSCLIIPKLPPRPLSFSISGQPCPLPTPLPASHLIPVQNGPKVSPGRCSKRQIYLQ